jgi:hypothetical protein
MSLEEVLVLEMRKEDRSRKLVFYLSRRRIDWKDGVNRNWQWICVVPISTNLFQMAVCVYDHPTEQEVQEGLQEGRLTHLSAFFTIYI